MLVRRLLFLIVFVLTIAAIGVAARYYPDWHWIVKQEQQFRERVTAAPVTSWCIGVSLYFVISLIPGTGGKSVIAGWLFGFWAALAMIELGLTAAAIVSFLLGRYAFGALVQSHWQHRLQFLARRMAGDGAFTLLMLRLAHAPFTLVNYGAGASSVPLGTFWWTTHVGILPGTVVFAFVGTQIPSLQAVADRGVWALVDWPLLAALLATFVFPLILSRTLGRGACRVRRMPLAATPPHLPTTAQMRESRNA